MANRYLGDDGHPIGIWRCRCGAMVSNPLAAIRHMTGNTTCQHREEGMAFYERSIRQRAAEAARRAREPQVP